MLSLILLIFAFVFALIWACRGWMPGAGAWAVPHLGWLAVALYILTLILGGRVL